MNLLSRYFGLNAEFLMFLSFLLEDDQGLILGRLMAPILDAIRLTFKPDIG